VELLLQTLMKNLKTNITTIENALEKVLNLRGVEFDYKIDGVHSIGFIAQEVEKVIPELVFGTDPKSVAYAKLCCNLSRSNQRTQSKG
jgi:trimeric autotransporter adhesin